MALFRLYEHRGHQAERLAENAREFALLITGQRRLLEMDGDGEGEDDMLMGLCERCRPLVEKRMRGKKMAGKRMPESRSRRRTPRVTDARSFADAILRR